MKGRGEGKGEKEPFIELPQLENEKIMNQFTL